MNIIYVSSVCSQTRFDKLVAEGKIDSQFQNQKFHNLLLSGLNTIQGVNITVISYYPINRIHSKGLKYEEEIVDDIKYVYPKQWNIPIMNHFSKYWNTFRAIRKHLKNDSIIVCNVMNFDECLAAQFISKKYGVKIAAIVADVPGLTSNANRNNWPLWKRVLKDAIEPLYIFSSKQYDAYMLLTSAMDAVVNPKHRPSIVIEGFADFKMKDIKNNLNQKSDPKVIMYAGGLHREYGIQMLVEAFEQSMHNGWELHVYGDGNYVPELENKQIHDSTIKFLGTKNNAEIVEEQIKATLLVNPRPTHEEFVKYSFPSKTLECMVSGTPLLTTNLPGMPEDYKNYVYLFMNESIEEYTEVLNNMFIKDSVEFHKKGCDAKNYMLKYKNNKFQALKFYELLKKM